VVGAGTGLGWFEQYNVVVVLSMMISATLKFGHELLSIIIRFALILLSTLDPASSVASQHDCGFRFPGGYREVRPLLEQVSI
jgi:hypothetical protein